MYVVAYIDRNRILRSVSTPDITAAFHLAEALEATPHLAGNVRVWTKAFGVWYDAWAREAEETAA